MRSARFLVCLLLLAAVLVDLAVMSAFYAVDYRDLQWPDPFLVVLFSLAFSQVGLVAIWAALGGTPLPWRLAGMVSVVALWSLGLAAAAEGSLTKSGKTDWTVLLLVHSLLFLAILLTVRSRGGWLLARTHVDSPSVRPRYQFSLGYLLAWLTATAIGLGMLRWSIDREDLNWDPGYWIGNVAALSSGNLVLAFAALWSVMGTKSLIHRSLTMCSATAIVTGLYWLVALQPDRFVGLTVLSFLQAMWLVAGLGVFRVAGYRFVRPGRVVE